MYPLVEFFHPPTFTLLCRLVRSFLHIMQKFHQLRAHLIVVGSAGVQKNTSGSVLQIKAGHFLTLCLKGCLLYTSYSAGYLGYHNIREGIVYSMNVIASRCLMDTVTPQLGIEYAENMLSLIHIWFRFYA